MIGNERRITLLLTLFPADPLSPVLLADIVSEVIGVLPEAHFGGPMSYSDAEKQMLRERRLERTPGYALPIITDMDFGHTVPQFTIPLGCRARIDSAAKRFEIIDIAVYT